MDFFSCTNISKSFGNEKILDKVNLSFPSFGIVSIIGPSGCGKSTLLKCLLGLDDFEGVVKFKDKEITNFSTFRNKYTGVIFQNFHLFEYLSVEENIKLFPKNKNYMKIVKMLGLESKLKTRVSLLSGGEKQRVAIARTLLKKPKIIFCDEITGSLDEDNQEVIMRYLKEISKEILIINISHNEYLVNKYSDHIISFKNHSFSFNTLFNKEDFKVQGKLRISSRQVFNHSINLMRKSMFKIVLSVLSLVISFCLSGTIISLNRSLKQYFEEYKMSCLDYNFMELSEISSIKIQNTSFSLVKQNRPKNLDAIKNEIEGCSACYNYSNLLNSYTMLRNNNEDLRVNLYPSESPKLTNYKKIIINSKLAEMLTTPYIHYLNERTIDYISSTNQIISDSFSLDIIFEVVDVNQEMDLFQEPTIYYSYSLMEKYLDSIHLTNFSKYIKSAVSLQERIARYYYDGDFYNTGSIYLRCQKKADVEKVIERVNKIEKDDYSYSLTSRSLTSFEAYNQLLDSIVNVIEIFLVLSLATSLALLILCINSLIIDEEKEIGIFKGLGILDEQVFSIITNQVNLIIIFSLVLSMLLRFVGYLALNIKFPFLNLLNYKNILYENMVIILFTLIVSLALINISKILVERINISRVLRED